VDYPGLLGADQFLVSYLTRLGADARLEAECVEANPFTRELSGEASH